MDTINSKEIKDYLHLYLGCECVTDDGRTGWFAGFDICEKDYSIVMITVRFPGEEEDWSVLNDNDECDRIKLVLRPLSDMTEEEAAHIGQLVYGKPDSVKWRIEHKNGYLKIYRKHYQKAITIDYASADLDFYDGDELDTSLRQIEIFQYLLSKSFDLFGLIDAGLAIDKTTQQKAL